MLREPLAVELPVEVRRLLDCIALARPLGGSPEEVAAYLIIRSIDDLMRCGQIKLGEAA